MKIAYFDTFSGVSGDMTLGAFLSAGLPLETLAAAIGTMQLPGVELQARHLTRNGIVAVKLDVVITSAQRHHRHLKDILAIIGASGLSERVRRDATSIFMEVAKAEAAVHNVPIEKVHFHEVGALDSIVDIVGAAVCLEHFGIERVYSSPVRLGSGGLVSTDHGMLPLPGPATAEILRGYPTVLTDIPFELTTPTGAAIIKAMSSGTLAAETLRLDRIGYGAGDREIPGHPNLLRVMVGEYLPSASGGDEVVVMETNIDDMNPEILPFVLERLLAGGALDAFLAPVQMKKGRPGVLLTAVCPPEAADGIARIIFAETTTIGVRTHAASRRKLARREETVATRLGPVRAKALDYDGRVRLAPEFEECRRLALERGLPLVEVYRIVEEDLKKAQK
jgi:uncharacterized protein (TIGR00299 family) protein